MMGFFDKLNPFHKKEKSPDMDMGGMGKDPFGASSGSDFGSQNFPDASNSTGGMDTSMSGGVGGMGTPSQPAFGQQPSFSPQSPYSQPPQASFSQPAQPSFGSPPSYSSPSYSAPQPTYGNDADYMHSKNLEVISSKI